MLDALQGEFNTQGILVYAFQESRTEYPVHLHSRPDDGMGLRVPN